jgi:hypothetical protein
MAANKRAAFQPGLNRSPPEEKHGIESVQLDNGNKPANGTPEQKRGKVYFEQPRRCSFSFLVT